MTATTPVRAEVRVDPVLAESAVWGVLSSGSPADGEARARHDRRCAHAYRIADAAERDAAFAAIARSEFAELGLADPLLEALDERPPLAERTRLLLVGQARASHDEGVTCEPGGAHLGVRLEPRRFVDRAGLLGWARHALGHAEDTLDPAFGFVPGWDGDGGGAQVRTAAQARLHRLWDVSVDGRLAAVGRAGPRSSARHRQRLAADLPGASPAVVDAAFARLWDGPRPDFPTLMAWAARPATLATGLEGREAALPRPDRCPLCRFPSDDVVVPDPAIAERVIAEYPDWRPEHGLCGRCGDRYRFAGRLGAGG